MPNNRTFYALQQIAIKPNASGATNATAPLNARNYGSGILAPTPVDEVQGLWEVPRGMQSVSVSTNFNREEAFQLGQVELYEYSERQPDVEITLEKVVDGTKPLWLMLTDPRFTDLVGKTAVYRTDLQFSIYADTQFRANQNAPLSTMLASGMYVSSATYTFPVDGAVTESMTLIGNDKIWANFDASVAGEDVEVYPPLLSPPDPETPAGVPSGVFGNETQAGVSELAGGDGGFGVVVVGSGIQRREEVAIARSILPADIPGVTAVVGSGVSANQLVAAGLTSAGATDYVATSQLVATANTDNVIEHIQNITISLDLGRDDIFELGSKRPFTKFVDFPIEVTTSIEAVTSQGDLVDARSDIDCGPDNTVPNNTIVIRTCDGLQVDVGDQNVITSVELGGGDTGGGNMTATYNYTSFNVFNVTHDNFDPRHRTIVFATGSSKFNVGGDQITNPL